MGNTSTRRFPQEDFAQPADRLAQRLLGQTLVRNLPTGERLAGRIVETEAYLGPEDQAAHTRNGHRSPRVESMWGPGGHAYVYFTYGMHHCLNIVAGRAGEPQAVLIRALEPTEGLDEMRRLRSAKRKPEAKPLRDRDLCSGPAKLCQALAIDLALDSVPLAGDSPLALEHTQPKSYQDHDVTTATRIGIDRAGEWAHKPLRWYVTASAHVSVR
ncbi:MAG: DNA-3-methyladenine glycosylase [Planctomycetota bacterium]